MSKAQKIEKPRAEWGSDVVVDLLKAFEFEYIAINPGATFRGLHDSLVNYGGNHAPEIILCTHEEIAVALAHGYARAKGRPMAAAVHNVVGLQHASMAIYNAWADRLPVIVLGGTGPMDTANRRPWIDWVHTAILSNGMISRPVSKRFRILLSGLIDWRRPSRRRRFTSAMTVMFKRSNSKAK